MNNLEKRLAAGSIKYELADQDGETLLVCDDLEFARQSQRANPQAVTVREIRCLLPQATAADDSDCALGRVLLKDPQGSVHTVWGEGGILQTLVELFLLLDAPASWTVLEARGMYDSDDSPYRRPPEKLGRLTREILGHITPENAEFSLMVLKTEACRADCLEDLLAAERSHNTAAHTREPICGFQVDGNGIPILTPEHLKKRYASVLGYFFLEALDDFEVSLDCENLQARALASPDPAEILPIVLKLCDIGGYHFFHPYSAARLCLTGSL